MPTGTPNPLPEWPTEPEEVGRQTWMRVSVNLTPQFVAHVLDAAGVAGEHPTSPFPSIQVMAFIARESPKNSRSR